MPGPYSSCVSPSILADKETAIPTYIQGSLWRRGLTKTQNPIQFAERTKCVSPQNLAIKLSLFPLSQTGQNSHLSQRRPLAAMNVMLMPESSVVILSPASNISFPFAKIIFYFSPLSSFRTFFSSLCADMNLDSGMLSGIMGAKIAVILPT